MTTPRVSLALYVGDGLIGNAMTRAWTRRPESHCEWVVDGKCYGASLMDDGVRSKDIILTNGNWDVRPMPWASAEQILDFYKRTEGAKYDYLGIYGAQIINRRVHDFLRWFCSEWCGAAVDFPTPEIHNPYTLSQMCDYRTKLYYEALNHA